MWAVATAHLSQADEFECRGAELNSQMWMDTECSGPSVIEPSVVLSRAYGQSTPDKHYISLMTIV